MEKKHYKKLSLLLLLTYFSLLFTACWDYKDIEDRALILSFGVDTPVPDRIRLDAEIAEFRPMSAQQTTYNITHFFGEGSNFDKARENLQVKTKGPLSNGPATAVIVSERLAQSDLFEDYLNRANRQYDLRKTVNLLISKRAPSDLMQLSTKSNTSIGFFVENNIQSLFKDTHIDISLANVITESRIKDLAVLIPTIDVVEGKPQYIGLGVIKDLKLIDIIDAADSNGVLFLMSPKTPLVLTLADPKSPANVLTFSTLVKKHKIKTSWENEKAVINVFLSVDASLTFQYKLQRKSSEDINELKYVLSNYIKKMITESINKSQQNYKVDIFEFVKHFKAQNPIQYRQIEWGKVYPEAEINVDVNVNITDKNAMEYENKDKLDKR
ncbi:Ger(x)C family spore germination protein [Clostridium peptidivorans]|uniref:Ger(x)C family spore germination protein n=1 Tax=Clostridium peptidivorans TaxID=100174 RepID=UPI000BE28533|nr:Ger(x)C family spore germination protein [Clostridium peptidivorans]